MTDLSELTRRQEYGCLLMVAATICPLLGWLAARWINLQAPDGPPRQDVILLSGIAFIGFGVIGAWLLIAGIVVFHGDQRSRSE